MDESDHVDKGEVKKVTCVLSIILEEELKERRNLVQHL